MLQDNHIRSFASLAVYDRGCKYFQKGAVGTVKSRSLDENSYYATVYGSDMYHVEVELNKAGDRVNHYDCDCPAALLYTGACKHVVAVLKAIQNQQRIQDIKQKKEASGRNLISLYSKAALQEERLAEARPLHLEPHLFIYHRGISIEKWLEFKIGYDRLYVLQSILELILKPGNGSELAIGKNLVIRPEEMRFEKGVSQGLWKLIMDAWRDDSGLHGMMTYSSTRAPHIDKKRFRLSDTEFQKFLDIMGDQPFQLTLDEIFDGTTEIVNGNPDLHLNIEDEKGDAVMFFGEENVITLDKDSRVIFCEGCIYRPEEYFSKKIAPFMSTMRDSERMRLSADLLGDFFCYVMPNLRKTAHVKTAQSFKDRFESLDLRVEVYLDYYKDGLAATLRYLYSDIAFNPVIQDSPKMDNEKRIIVRDRILEQRVLRLFEKYGFEREHSRLVQPDEERTFDFIIEGIPRLDEMAEIYYEEAFEKKPVKRFTPPAIGVSVNDENILELNFDKSEYDFDEMLGILSAYKEKRRYHRMKDGTFVTLGEQQLDTLAELAEEVAHKGDKKAVRDGRMELPISKALYLDAMAGDGLKLVESDRFKTFVGDIKNPQNAKAPVPRELKDVLRDYQVTGYRWMKALSKYGLGGILADDMGLGKTLQTIAFILSYRDVMDYPVLVVAPTSLVYNWLEEIGKFAPQLKAVVVDGTKSARKEQLEEGVKNADVIVTTYNLLKRDIALYEKQQFSYCFLDEAQQIKNPVTQNAKAVKKIKAIGRFALTGTPIENTLTELWSIFDFIMPGYLYSHKKFKQSFELPVVRAQEEKAKNKLIRHISPFILRRMKQDVLTELPDKVERRMINVMTPEQEKVYRAYFVQAKKDFAAILSAYGFAESRLKILALLTRLRQIACDPSLFLEGYGGGSGKLDMLEEMVSEAVESGHRILIFSQFTTMLQKIGSRLANRDLGYMYLDGSTPSKKRVEMVKEFNEGHHPVFLISLKAGGTGLNLVGADMVIHYDPWWNPAVEDQATDRAYRIGQKNNVQVLKLITKDTIEEKIYDLQEKKKSLIGEMLQPGESFLSRLSENEIWELFKGK